MKQIIHAILVLCLILLAACTNTLTGQVVLEHNEKVSVRLPISVYDATLTYFFATIDQGYYAEEGLDVTFNFGTSETNPAKMVAVGADDFGVLGGPDTLLVARSKGIPLKAFAIMHQDSNFPVIITMKDSGLTELNDLEGKKIGFFYGHISTDVMRTLLNDNGVGYKEVDVGFDFSQFITGKIDALAFAFRTHAPMYLREKGIAVNIISPKDYGITTDGYTIFATENTLEKNPELVRKFWRATSKGIRFVKENPEEAILSITSRGKNLKYEVELEKLIMYNEVINEPIGYMDFEMYKRPYDRLLKAGVIKKSFDLREAYTLKILEAISD